MPDSSIPLVEDIRYLPSTVSFRHTEGGVLELKEEDNVIPEVSIYRAFPFSHAECYLSVRDRDGKEIGIVQELQQLDMNSQAAIQLELKRRYFIPKVNTIVSIREKNNVWKWDVLTDRGSLRFELETLHEHVQPSPDGGMILIDSFGRRCIVPPASELDDGSKRWLNRLF
ncbi:DUF1854 domain-containing protein [Paenibacillus alvei]|uniref:DUF1854 domain-containing protein n=1 Tax=Paenibacillus TaxID=44249 RepID=UPI000287C545|nr:MULTISPECIES: DUF1854 domain-containing protein [Paenibacillus]EJW14895.1 hypothetical protein PAV_10c00130 [Paenibacillus alvei DSM 29]MCY9539135.1 DUF1854 domain-containing protein [Paenibacillus alvei]MCY9704326.1 DUF1854 domain-containing protein [Paenibacillus alvei]MCY9734357.1 DUF1854 domain-containing protein [Paenibacillus alvei]MCY9753535.1 DUF1854 domain-containing protein [Paenibacillus alvei]